MNAPTQSLSREAALRGQRGSESPVSRNQFEPSAAGIGSGPLAKTSANSSGENKKRLFMSHSKNHDLGRLNESGCGLTALEVHLAGRTCSDNRSDPLITYR